MTIVATPAYRPVPAPTLEAITKATGEESLARAIVAALMAPLALIGSSLAELLSRGDRDPSRGVDWSLLRRRLLRAVRGPLADEAQRGARTATASIGVSFDLVPVRAVAAAEAHAAELVDAITDTARTAVRSIIVRAQREGRSVDAVVAEVRSVIGLHPRWAAAVANRRRALESAKTPMPAARIDALVAAYRSRLLDLQARTLARTELLRSSNMGAMEGYRQAVEAGALPPDFGRKWVTAKDERRCEICRDLAGKVVHGLTEDYLSIVGPIRHPPAHFSCRCRQITKAS